MAVPKRLITSNKTSGPSLSFCSRIWVYSYLYHNINKSASVQYGWLNKRLHLVTSSNWRSLYFWSPAASSPPGNTVFFTVSSTSATVSPVWNRPIIHDASRQTSWILFCTYKRMRENRNHEAAASRKKIMVIWFESAKKSFESGLFHRRI